MDKSVCIITNNVMVKDKYGDSLDISYLAGQYIDVLKLARDMIHKGYRLISHPLAGSVKPNETPFRTIVLSEGKVLDVESLIIIESSMASAEKFQKDSQVRHWRESVLDDFRFVDLKLLESALESIGK